MERVAELEAAKSAAIANNDFALAGSLHTEIESAKLDAAAAQQAVLDELEAAKQAAIAANDFALAGAIQAKLLAAQQGAPAAPSPRAEEEEKQAPPPAQPEEREVVVASAPPAAAVAATAAAGGGIDPETATFDQLKDIPDDQLTGRQLRRKYPPPEPEPGSDFRQQARMLKLSPAVTEMNAVVEEGVKRTYREKVRPLEQKFMYNKMNALLSDAEISAKPSVLLIGQYSVGKTTFIRNLLGCDFGERIGPEPTTDKFVAVMHGEESKIVPGNALVVYPNTPFRNLSSFGTDFLNRFEGSFTNADILEDLTLIDSPGILAGEKQKNGRQYSFDKVVSWFAERSDMILLLFDANKLDISDELKSVMLLMAPHANKLRVVLNKADGCDQQSLMRVYGALMWQISSVIKTPEVTRVYIGSFRDEPYEEVGRWNAEFFDKERSDLLRDLVALPRLSMIRKINDLIKRARHAKVHAYIIGYLKEQLPTFGKAAKQKEMLDNLPGVFKDVCTKYDLVEGDFPDPDMFRRTFGDMDFNLFPLPNPKMIGAVDRVLVHNVSMLMSLLPDKSAYGNDAKQFSAKPSGAMTPELEIFREDLMGAGEGWEAVHHTKADSTRWQLDESALACPCCATEFGTFTRKHHCRQCGGIFCDTCTTMTNLTSGGHTARWCVGCKATSVV